MEALRRIVEWYFAIPAAQAGQGNSFSLVFGEGANGAVSRGLIGVGVIAGLAVAAIYRIEATRLASRVRWGLIGLRLVTLLVLLVMISGASLSIQKTGLPYLVVLVDTSASMGIADQYLDRTLADAARRRVQAAKLTEPQRLEVAKAVLLDPRSPLLAQWPERYRLKLYAFDETLSPLVDDAVAEPAALEQALRSLRPLGLETRPAYCLEQVFEEFRGATPAAIVVFTDGIASRSTSELTTNAAQTARELSIPLLTVGMGSADPDRDLELTDLLVERVAILGDPVVFTVRGRSWGLAGEKVQATLRKAGDTRVLATTEILPTTSPFSLELLTTPTEEGDHTFEIELTPVAGESTLENNRLTTTVSVRRTKIRVLLVERTPRWEFRHLKPLLERDEMVELRTVLQDSDVDFLREDRTALAGFPPRASDLDEFDVVIWGDVDLDQINPQSLTHLRDFVSEKGGGLILIGGERHNPKEFRGTPLEALCPVPLDALELPTAEELAGSGFTMEPTPDGRTQAFLRLDEGPTNDLWSTLPPLHWSWKVLRNKPGAVTLTSQGGAGGRPVLVWQRYGAGQVLFHATDELWQWRREREDAIYGRYWGQAIRQLCRAKLLGSSQSVKLSSDRPVYTVGEPIRLFARAPSGVAPAEGTNLVALIASTGDPIRVPLARIEDGQYEATLPSQPVGQYRASIETDDAATAAEGCQFRVELPNREMRDRAANHADLEQAAKTSRGKFYHWSQASQLAREIPPGRPVTQAASDLVPLWNRWEPFTVLVLCLTLEWVLRRRSRLA